MKASLSEKIILLTGASQGLGAQVAKAYAAAGATVILTGRNQKNLEKVYDEIVAAGSAEPYALVFDFNEAKEKEYKQFAQAIAEVSDGKLDGVVHCAARFDALSPLEFQTIDAWLDQYKVNAVAPMALTRALQPLLLASDDASVIFVSESHSVQPQAYWGGFGASNAALNYLCGTVADEWSRFENLRANVLIPGNIHSPQRIKTHPGEGEAERKAIAQILPDFVYWMSRESRGRSGEIVFL